MKKHNVVKVATLENVPVSDAIVEASNVEPTEKEIAAIEKGDNVVKEKDLLLSIVREFKFTLSQGVDVLSHLVPKDNVDKVSSWVAWVGACKELFITFLASLVNVETLTNGVERIAIDAENWGTWKRFCIQMQFGYNGAQGSKSMFPTTGKTLLPYKVAATLYTWFIKCRNSQTQEVISTNVGTFRMSYDNTRFFLTPVGRSFGSLGEYKTFLTMPEKVTEKEVKVEVKNVETKK